MLRIVAGVAVVAVLVALWQTSRAGRLSDQLHGFEMQLESCARISQRLMEGSEINGSIPDDLRDYDPSQWLLGGE